MSSAVNCLSITASCVWFENSAASQEATSNDAWCDQICRLSVLGHTQASVFSSTDKVALGAEDVQVGSAVVVACQGPLVWMLKHKTWSNDCPIL
jgi:hypothetical protein